MDEVFAGVQTELGLYEIGSYRDTRNPRDSALVEFTKDGKTWEVMTTRLPGESIIIFNLSSFANRTLSIQRCEKGLVKWP